MRRQRLLLDAYLGSAAFAAARDRVLRAPPHRQRGVLVNAGGRKLLTHLVVTLRVLRHHLNCTLPVEVAWHGPDEMDAATLAALDSHFGPVTGFDALAQPLEQHHRNRATSSQGRPAKLGPWPTKVLALLRSSFRHVLLLDSDSLPLADPSRLFDDPLYQQRGALFWPDFWPNWVQDDAYRLLGLNATAAKALLAEGKGWGRRDCESGQLLVDRGRHLDALEVAFYANSFDDVLYSQVHGDKDLFPLAFAAAGKGREYAQVVVPPGGVFRWGKGQLEVKGQKTAVDGWQLVGAIQHDNWGAPAFFHRTMNKPSLDSEQWPAELVTGPLPIRHDLNPKYMYIQLSP
ncbi:hypothetical protein MNEG_10940 [Monoraphidium neglectum]|uniref:Uncharacterized protein n=1 Tax=Monoraphidium neglectum TaxID=145388 RepID=A0A0D2JB84_9CHLO|nr:hypothetical protein MNEG_10940 [Monoraphidium neglectum]KIY97022.1 hypothetical protein MNEG_10940 [Monoraphidium neglectum]|eukprot:XP_013896042.1 hypothetical protein MNEG_10940 [Monoraphidium neglectum]